MMVTENNQELIKAFIRILLDIGISEETIEFSIAALETKEQMDRVVDCIAEHPTMTESELLKKIIAITDEEVDSIEERPTMTESELLQKIMATTDEEMETLDKSSPYWEALLGLINSINQVIPLKEENQVLIVLSLNTEEKVSKFNKWIRARLIGENDLQATEAEIVRAAVHINKGIL